MRLREEEWKVLIHIALAATMGEVTDGPRVREAEEAAIMGEGAEVLNSLLALGLIRLRPGLIPALTWNGVRMVVGRLAQLAATNQR